MRKLLVWTVLSVSVVALAACGGSGTTSSPSGAGGTPAIGGGGNADDFCNALKTDAAEFKKIGSNVNQQQFEAVFTDLTNKAPAEIKADMAALSAFLKASASFASQVSADPSQAESLASQFSGQEAAVTAASANITKFAKDRCGIDLNSDSSTDSSSSS